MYACEKWATTKDDELKLSIVEVLREKS